MCVFVEVLWENKGFVIVYMCFVVVCILVKFYWKDMIKLKFKVKKGEKGKESSSLFNFGDSKVSIICDFC